MRKLLILTYLIIFTVKVFPQYENFAYQLYLYDNIYSKINDSSFTMADIIAIEENEKKRKDFIKKLEAEINYYDAQIKRLNLSVNQLSNDLKISKQNLSKVMLFLYLTKKAFSNEFVFVFSSKSFQQAFMRYNFLKIIVLYLKNLLHSINMLKKNYELKKQLLQKKIDLRKQLVKDLNDQKSLEKFFYEKQTSMIKILEQKEKTFRLQLNNYLQNQNHISKLLEKFNEKIQDSVRNYTQRFKKAKGKIPLPLNDAIVISSFGVHSHTKFSGITYFNNGLDLTSHTDTLVKAVFDGNVAKVVTLPDNSKAVLIRHGKFFTVYADLNDVFVVDSQIVFQGQLIGTISEKTSNYSFPVLNFQIWNGKNKLNPAKWLDL